VKQFLPLLFAGILFLASCEQKKQSGAVHYNIDSLLQKQIELLVQEKAVLTKTASIDSVEEIKSFTPGDTIAWQHELDVFKEISTINKSVNSQLYTIALRENDTASNLLVNTYSTREALPVQSLRIYYFKTPSRIRKIEAIVQEKNSLLTSERLLTMEFDEVYNKIALKSYSITGGQKMFLGDSVQFSVKGSIKLP